MSSCNSHMKWIFKFFSWNGIRNQGWNYMLSDTIQRSLNSTHMHVSHANTTGTGINDDILRPNSHQNFQNLDLVLLSAPKYIWWANQNSIKAQWPILYTHTLQQRRCKMNTYRHVHILRSSFYLDKDRKTLSTAAEQKLSRWDIASYIFSPSELETLICGDISCTNALIVIAFII